VDQILQRIRIGELPYRVDEGFMFVDVAPPPPPTFTVLSEAEVDALRTFEQRSEQQSVVDLNDDDGVKQYNDHDDEETQSPDNDEASVDLGDWRTARKRVAMTRIPPGQRAKPQAA
jgi:hypothetical protein